MKKDSLKDLVRYMQGLVYNSRGLKGEVSAREVYIEYKKKGGKRSFASILGEKGNIYLMRK